MSIYEKMLKTGCEIDSHESDLYVPLTPETAAIVKEYEHKGNVTTFIHQTQKTRWYDIPFAYAPFWDKKLTPKGR